MRYVIGIDQSTQGTKAVLFDEDGTIVKRADIKHKQWINEYGWVSHDAEEIYQNVLKAVEKVVAAAGISKGAIETVGISNQRETTVVWNREGTPLDKAIVWQCSRAKTITDELGAYSEEIRYKTGIPLSPFFPAAKMAWLLRNVIQGDDYYLGTIDSWLIYKLTGGKVFKTDYSNASRTQLLNLHTLQWDEEICRLFGIDSSHLPEIADSNAVFGFTDFGGYLDQPIPIHCAIGDSHAALFGQGCHQEGMIKTTYGTGSSIMMNIGSQFKASTCGLATSLAWAEDGTVAYVLEGNINYTGAVISWLHHDLKLMETPDELETAAIQANQEDTTVLIPAFSGLSAPHWNDKAKAMFYGMTRTTGKFEILKASMESIAYQIYDVLAAMEHDSGISIEELRVDGGPTKNAYLMQFQSDIANVRIGVPKQEELSAIGAAYMAGIGQGVYQKEQLFGRSELIYYTPKMSGAKREGKLKNWKEAIDLIVNR